VIKYKLLRKDLTTHNGFKWEVGKQYVTDKPGNELCSEQVFHFYESPETAAVFTKRHADILDPVCYSVEIDSVVAFDGLKGGARKMRLIKQVKLPIFTKRQLVIFAIFSARSIAKNLNKNIPQWDEWADAYLSNADATDATDAADAADAAYYDADAAYYAAASAADAAVYDADAAYYAAAYYAANAAAAAAAAAAAVYDADAAFASASAADAAVYTAVYAANSAAEANAACAAAAAANAALAAAAADAAYPDFTALAKQALNYE